MSPLFLSSPLLSSHHTKSSSLLLSIRLPSPVSFHPHRCRATGMTRNGNGTGRRRRRSVVRSVCRRAIPTTTNLRSLTTKKLRTRNEEEAAAGGSVDSAGLVSHRRLSGMISPVARRTRGWISSTPTPPRRRRRRSQTRRERRRMDGRTDGRTGDERIGDNHPDIPPPPTPTPPYYFGSARSSIVGNATRR